VDPSCGSPDAVKASLWCPFRGRGPPLDCAFVHVGSEQHPALIVVTLVRERHADQLAPTPQHGGSTLFGPDRSAMMRIVPYAFRIRFVLAETVRLGLNHPEITMASSEADGEDVVLRCSEPDDEISKARTLLLTGQSYGSDEDARAAASRWSD
jgi:hypothetical protein